MTKEREKNGEEVLHVRNFMREIKKRFPIRQDHKVVEYTWTRVKNNFKHTNFKK